MDISHSVNDFDYILFKSCMDGRYLLPLLAVIVIIWDAVKILKLEPPFGEVDVRHREHLMCNRQEEVNLFVDFISEEEFKA